MCGIGGFEGRGESDGEIAALMLGSLGPRGPDGGWELERGRWRLAQTRLSIIDLSPRVRYPMPNEAEDVWLLFNGEIYNHRSLRSELEARGHRFATDCDAEVVVHGWEEWGSGVFGRLNGMFAVALFDEPAGELVLARDRFGIKPLVRTTEGRFAFASDAMTLVRAGLSAGEADLAALSEFATLHYIAPPLTGLRDVAQLEPGTALRRRADGVEAVERWAAPLFDGDPPGGEIDVGDLDRVLAGAVARQLQADVPVGVFLSSGIDSALVLSYAVQAGARPRAFTLGFRGHGDYDERPAAQALAARWEVPHSYEDLELGFGEAIHLHSQAFAEPFADASAIAMLPLARLARREVSVALSGTGGDDLFGGYYRHRAHLLLRALRLLPRPALSRVGRLGTGRGAERSSGTALARSYVGRLAAAGADGPFAQYLSLIDTETAARAGSALRFEVDPEGVKRGLAVRCSLGGRVRRPLRDLQRFELSTYLAGDLLVKEDRSTMAVGLEARVPLLDEEVARVAARADDGQKISLRAGKLLLRELARRRVPEVAGGRKRGFAVPLQELLRGPWRAECAEWLRESESELVDGAAAVHLLDRKSGPLDVWALCALRAWEDRLGRERRASP